MRLIDADELKQTMIDTMEALLKNPKMDRQEAHILAAFHTVGEMIDDAPTITPDMAQVLAYECGKAERKRGEWIEENRRPKSMMFYCSECHRTAYDQQNHHGGQKRCRYAFCPNCGAKMEEEK